jgi:hypothetical protein
MNDPNNQEIARLARMLEEVSSADPHAMSEPGNAEAASLREAWLAFAQLVRAADDSLPETPASMLMAMPATAAVPAQKPRRRFGLIAAVAAALLVAVSLGWWIARGNWPHRDRGNEPSLAQTTTPGSPTPQVINQDSPKPAVAMAPKASAEKTVATKSANKSANADTVTKAATSAWEDPLETQISSVSQQIRDVEQNWQRRADDLDVVQYKIDEVTNAVQNDEL